MPKSYQRRQRACFGKLMWKHSNCPCQFTVVLRLIWVISACRHSLFCTGSPGHADCPEKPRSSCSSPVSLCSQGSNEHQQGISALDGAVNIPQMRVKEKQDKGREKKKGDQLKTKTAGMLNSAIYGRCLRGKRYQDILPKPPPPPRAFLAPV